MRRSDDMPLDPFELAELEAIEAALAGRAVDPEHAELAELSILLATGRQDPDAAFGRELDARVVRRFREPAARPRLGSWIRRPAVAAGLTACLAAAVVLVTMQLSNRPTVRLGSPTHAAPPLVNAGSSPPQSPPRTSFGTSVTRTPASSSSAGATAGVLAAPAPLPNGRRQVKSAQLTLRTSRDRIDAVAQEVFNVVSRENGIVKRSQVTQGRQPGGDYADFSLGIPTSRLQDALDQLSRLRYADVVSRTDATEDVNDRYLSDEQRLADARTLRTSLLKQLAAATTTTQIDSLEAQIHDAEASIASRQSALRRLQRRIGYSSVNVQVNQSPIVYPLAKRASGTGHGLTLARAAHDAGRVLIVAAGVILIGLAALVPVGLLLALAAWIARWLRRRRREQALDAA